MVIQLRHIALRCSPKRLEQLSFECKPSLKVESKLSHFDENLFVQACDMLCGSIQTGIFVGVRVNAVLPFCVGLNTYTLDHPLLDLKPQVI
jgi:hypothetical protein